MNKFRITTLLFLCTMIFNSCTKESNKAEYSGEDLSDIAFIMRNSDTKETRFQINLDTEWSLYAGSKNVENINFSKPVAEGKKAGIFPINNVSDSTRNYYQLITPIGKAILAERRLPMIGGFNFRDLGGYRTEDGQYVKWGKIFRSDDLFHLTDADLAYLSSIPLISIVDFRSAEEIKQAPDKLPASVKEEFVYSISPGNMTNIVMDSLTNKTDIDFAHLMEELNLMLVSDSAIVDQYKKFFQLLSDEKNIPLMFHCSAGKDRTGMGAALILYSLGVKEETIMQDYLSSNVYLEDKYRDLTTKHPDLKPLFEVRKQYLQNGLTYIKENYGSVENYLAKVLEVDINKMREMYLYK